MLNLVLPNGEEREIDRITSIILSEDGLSIECTLPNIEAIHEIRIKNPSSFQEAHRLAEGLARQIDQGHSMIFVD